MSTSSAKKALCVLGLFVVGAPLGKAQLPTHPFLGAPPFEAFPEDIAFHKVGQWPGYTRGHYRDFATDGSRLFIGSTSGSVHEFDLSDPRDPYPFDGLGGFGFSYDIVIDGGSLYLLNRSGIDVFDISMSGKMVLTKELSPHEGTSFGGLAAKDGYIYFSAPRGVRILDAAGAGAIPARPMTVPLIAGTRISDIIRSRDHLIATSDHRFFVFDLTDPSAPVEIANTPVIPRVFAFDAEGDLVALATNSGLITVGLSDPTTPQFLEVVDMEESFHATAIKGDVVVGLTGLDVRVYDISDPENPILVGTTTVTEPSFRVEVVGDFVYVSHGMGSVSIFSLTEPFPEVIPRSGFDNSGYATDLEIAGETAYLADGAQGVAVIDIGQQEQPLALQLIQTGEAAEAIQLVGSRLYVDVGDAGIQVYDVSVPGNATPIGQIEIAGKFEVVGTRVYVAAGESGLVILDATDLGAVVEIASLLRVVDDDEEIPHFIDVAVVGNRAFIAATESDLLVADISDPVDPKLVGGLNFGYRQGTAVKVIDDLLFLMFRDGDDESSTEIFDISDPMRLPVSKQRFDLCCGATATGSRAYFTSFGIHAVDVEFPHFPVSIGGYEGSGNAIEAEVIGDRLYVASGESGLQIFEIGEFEGHLLDPRIEIGEDGVDFVFDALVPEGNLFRVQSSGDLSYWSVPSEDIDYTRHFTGRGRPWRMSVGGDLREDMEERNHYRARGGRGLVLDRYYEPPEEFDLPED